MSLDAFKHSARGATLAPILHAAIAEMETLSRHAKPAVQAVSRQVADALGDLSNTEKQHVGRWVRDLLGERGWQPAGRARLDRGEAFTWGAVYRREGAPKPIQGDGRARMAAARALVASLPNPVIDVDTFIAERHAQAALGN